MCTKFVLVKSVPRATARSVASFVENDVFLLFGVPQVIMVDNGPQFISSTFRKLVSHYQVPHVWYSAAFHPQVNFVERVNRVVGTAIRSYIADNHRTWDEHIYKIGNCELW